MKKILALALSFILVFSLTTTFASAEDYSFESDGGLLDLVDEMTPDGASDELVSFILAYSEFVEYFLEVPVMEDFESVDEEIEFLDSFLNNFTELYNSVKEAFEQLNDEDCLLFSDGFADKELMGEMMFGESDVLIDTLIIPMLELMKNKDQFKSDYNLFNEIGELLDKCSEELSEEYLASLFDYDMDEDYDYDYSVEIGAFTDIFCDEALQVSVKVDEEKFLRFIPQETASYIFSSSGEYDSVCSLYDQDGNYLDYGDDTDEDYNFAFSYELEKDVTYYLGLSTYEDQTVEFSVLVTPGFIEEENSYGFNLLYLITDPSLLDIRYFIDKDNVSRAQYDNLRNVIIKSNNLSDDMNDYLNGIGFDAILAGIPECLDIYEASVDSELLFGDVNSDGTVNTKDALRLKQYNANYEVEIDKILTDVNADGEFNAKDSLLLSQYNANWDLILG